MKLMAGDADELMQMSEMEIVCQAGYRARRRSAKEPIAAGQAWAFRSARDGLKPARIGRSGATSKFPKSDHSLTPL